MTLTTLPKLISQTPQRTFLIREEPPHYLKQDQLFTKLIKVFFAEFLEVFFPDIHNQINFEHVTFLPEKMFTETNDCSKRVVSLFANVKWKKNDTLVVVCVGPTSYYPLDFQFRMFNNLHKIDKLSFSITIYNYESYLGRNKCNIPISDLEVLYFNYFSLYLRKQNWRKLIKTDNPVAAAFLSKMKYAENEKVKVKLSFFKILARLKLDMEKNVLLFRFFETNLKLSNIEKAIFVEEINKLENAKEILEIIFYMKKEEGQ
ncbi:hypothetical protein [Pseudogracilibacillus sp. SO30301A]|uniref:hypothetical protein n=1 Tax=Pseudogracilibacillus sp. SO30301A TaxID=3098291 RepID=UPI00300E4DE7